MQIEYVELNKDNFNTYSLDDFDRRQVVEYVEEWSIVDKRKLAVRMLEGIAFGKFLVGAMSGGKIVGFAFVDNNIFGNKEKYIDLIEFYVSAAYRRRGIGERLFRIACNFARQAGAAKLYVSAHSAEESIAAYVKYGCELAQELNADLAEKEPCDVPLEFDLSAELQSHLS